MFWLRLTGRVQKIFRREDTAKSETEEELKLHIELRMRELRARGLSERAARRRAKEAFGEWSEIMRDSLQERGDMTTTPWIRSALSVWMQDFKYAARMALKNSLFTGVIVFTLALAIGATTTIFSVVYGVLLRPLPYAKPQQIVSLSEVGTNGKPMNFADLNFDDLRSMNRSLQGMVEYSGGTTAISGGSEPVRNTVADVSRDFFVVFRVNPILGRPFSPVEQREGAAPTVLVSYDFWKQNLQGSRDLASLKLTIQRKLYSVIGVLPAGFHFPFHANLWIPRELDSETSSRTAHNFQVVARLRDGVSVQQAHADLADIARRLKEQYRDETNMVDVSIVPLQQSMTAGVSSTLYVLFAAVGFLLLVACANVVNLLVAQTAARVRELGVRSALGATRARLVAQFLSEALLLALSSTSLGVLAAYAGVNALLTVAPKDLPRPESVGINLPVLLFGIGVAVVVATGLGVFTALRATSGGFRESLREGGRGQAGSRRSQSIGRVIVSAQLAITFTLLIGAGLLGRSLMTVLSVNPGFRTDHIVAMNLSVSGVNARDETGKARQVAFLNSLFTQLRGIPGVQETGGVESMPLQQSLFDGTYALIGPGDVPKTNQDFTRLFRDKEHAGDAEYCVTSEGYFRALQIPLVNGRLFDDRDTESAPHVALVSESLAREKWPKQDPLGHTIEFGNMDGDVRLLTVIGVVGDTHESGLETPAQPIIYVNYRQRPEKTWGFSVVMRTSVDTAAVVSAAREILRRLDPTVAPRFSTFEQIYSASLGSRKFNLILIAFFGLTAFSLAIAGVYGVMSYAVSQRTQEIGVRVALGACTSDVLGMILGQGMRTTLVGVAIGVVGAVAITRTIQSLLFGVKSTDPATFITVSLILISVAALASYLPAWRATKVDPMVALRHE